MTTTSPGTSLIHDADGIDSDSAEDLVHPELVYEFARRQGTGSAASIAVALIATGVLWGQLPLEILLSWTALQAVLAIASWLRWRPFTDRDILESV